RRVGAHPLADVYGDAADVATPELDLARVQTGADLEPERVDGGTDRQRAPDGAGRTVEGGEHAVTRHLDLGPAMAHELATHDVVVPIEEHAPGLVALPARPRGRSDDVREED